MFSNGSLLLLLRVLNTTLFESWEIVGPYPSWWVFNLMLLLLQGMNCFWSYLIIKIACKTVSKGKVSENSLSLVRPRNVRVFLAPLKSLVSDFIRISAISSQTTLNHKLHYFLPSSSLFKKCLCWLCLWWCPVTCISNFAFNDDILFIVVFFSLSL